VSDILQILQISLLFLFCRNLKPHLYAYHLFNNHVYVITTITHSVEGTSAIWWRNLFSEKRLKTTSQQTLIATNDNGFAVVLLLNPCVIRCLDLTDWYAYGFRFVIFFFSVFHFITISIKERFLSNFVDTVGYSTQASCLLKILLKPLQTPYSKMAENTLFFCLYVNRPLLPHFKPNIPLNSADGIETARDN